MQVDFASSGGIANVELNYRGDTNTMSEDQARELERLVQSSGILDLEQEDATPQPRAAAGPPDVIAYRISLSEGPRQTTLWFNDVTAPATIRPLLGYLRKLAIEQKKRGGETR